MGAEDSPGSLASMDHAGLCCAHHGENLVSHPVSPQGWAGAFHPVPRPRGAINPPRTHRYNGPNLVLKYDKARGRLVNVAEDERDSPYYALRDRQGNAIGVTACDIDGDGREEIYFLNTNNAFSGEPCWRLCPKPRAGGELPARPPVTFGA